MPKQAVIQKRSKAAGCFSLREKVEMVARCKLRGEDATGVVPAFYTRHGLPAPRHPAQPLSGFAKAFQNRLAEDDAEALALAEEFGFELVEVEHTK